jgi:23S rRNA (guanosine2251-2'-O)-methyltransferase
MMSRRSKSAGREQRIRYGEDLIWGIHPILEALRNQPRRVVELFVQKDKRGTAWQEIIETARRTGIKLIFVDRLHISDSPDPVNHQGVAARVAPVPFLDLDEVLSNFRSAINNGEQPRLMACDSIQDPHNLGAIIRSAHAAGVDHLIVTRERSAPLAGTAEKSSAGAMSRLKICRVRNLSEALKKIKDAGGWIFGAVKDDQAQSIYRTDFNLPACLVVGNEGSGLRPLVRRHCDVLVSIPMAGEIDSLNSSVAAAVILFEMLRQSLH